MNIQIDQLAVIVRPLLDWYHQNKRDLPWRHNATPYRVWISEIMLQQTRVDPVIPYYQRFLECLPDVETLAQVSQDQLMKLWEGLGYYSRANHLKKAAQIIAENGAFPDSFEGWLSLPGIGEYTAGAICSIALGLPTPAVDGNVLRVLSRILGSEEDIALPATKKTFTAALQQVYPVYDTSSFTQSLMELGAIICLPNGEPKCADCPVKDICFSFQNNCTDRIPVKTAKKARKVEEKTVFILRFHDKIALCQRPSKGLLANLWEYPNCSGTLTPEQAAAFWAALEPEKIKKLPPSIHIFTHIEWHMSGFEIQVSKSKAETKLEWLPIASVLGEKAIPSAFRCYTDYLKDLRYKEIEP